MFLGVKYKSAKCFQGEKCYIVGSKVCVSLGNASTSVEEGRF